jgi:hypothetical protein
LARVIPEPLAERILNVETPLPPSPATLDEPKRSEKIDPITFDEGMSPGQRQLQSERRIAWRVAGALILLNVLMNVTTAAFGLVDNVTAIVVSTIVDLIVVINLFRDRKWARDLAIWRLALGLVVYGIMNGISDGIVGALVTVITVGAILLVLVGEPRRWRTVVGSVLFVITFLVLMALLMISGFTSRATGLSAPSMELLSEARSALQAGDHTEAIRLYGQLTRDEPDSAVAFYGLCSAYQESGDPSLALDACETASELAPQDANIHSYLGFVLLNMSRYEEAETAAETAIDLNDEDYFGFFIRGASRFALNKEGYAEDFARSLDLAPTASERAAFEDAITQITGQ